jgi:hypothetical protein
MLVSCTVCVHLQQALAAVGSGFLYRSTTHLLPSPSLPAYHSVTLSPFTSPSRLARLSTMSSISTLQEKDWVLEAVDPAHIEHGSSIRSVRAEGVDLLARSIQYA